MSTRGNHRSTSERIKVLLGAGVPIDKVAEACGVAESTVSGYMMDPEFKSAVQDLRYQNLQEQNDIDSNYRGMESDLQKKLKEIIPYMMNPGQILAAMRIVNGTVRRGVQAPVQPEAGSKEVVVLNIPTRIQQVFITNVNNQVIKAGDQELLTVQSHRMKELLDNHNQRRLENSGGSNVSHPQVSGNAGAPQGVSSY